MKGNNFEINHISFSTTISKTLNISLQPFNNETIVSPDSDVLFDIYFIPKPGLAKVIDLDGNIINEIVTPANWDGTKRNRSIANAGYYAVIVNKKVYQVSLIR